jgi:hypothetical protein
MRARLQPVPAAATSASTTANARQVIREVQQRYAALGHGRDRGIGARDPTARR